MADAQGGQGSLELALGIASLGGGLMAEEGQAIGVDGHGKAHAEEDGAEVLEVGPCGVGVHEGGGDVLAGVVIDGEEEGLLGVGRPPGVDGGVVLPEFPNAGAFPSATWAGLGGVLVEEARVVGAGMGGDRAAMAGEAVVAGELIGDELEIGGLRAGQKSRKDRLDGLGP